MGHAMHLQSSRLRGDGARCDWIAKRSRGVQPMKLGIAVLRTATVALTVMSLWTAAHARAAAAEHLMVPSRAMGRDIPVAFQAGGPHAVYLLDAFDAGDTVTNWVSAGNAMNTLGGRGVSVVAPAGGAFSLYAYWEQDGSKRWEMFLSAELHGSRHPMNSVGPLSATPLNQTAARAVPWGHRNTAAAYAISV
jgi:S-formylglutathione hydrolase FrmB